MVKFMRKIPAGTLIVPMLISALVHTIWPNLFQIGGITEQFLGGQSINFIIGMLTFSSGLSIDLGMLKQLFKRHGVILLTKMVIAVSLSLMYMTVFGQSGILGISAVAFTVALCSINPSIYISLMNDYGTEIDKAAFGLTGLFSIPVLPVLIYSISGSGQIEWMPIVSTLVPLILGIVLGNLDPDFKDLFSGAIGIMLPVLGWNIGQGMNLVEGLQAGFSGLILTVFYYIATSPLVIVDRRLLGNDGLPAVAMNASAGLSTSFPAIIAASNPAVAPYVSDATAQLLMVSLITSIVTPMIVRRLYKHQPE